MRFTTFDITSNIDLNEGGRLFGESGKRIVAPFKFAQPPQLRLSGRIDGPASGAPHEHVRIEARSPEAFSFYDFPLHGVELTATLDNDDLAIESLRTGFAGGLISGTATATLKKDDRRLKFAGVLTGADVGEAIHSLEAFQALRHPSPNTEKKHSVASESVKGRLDLSLAAAGRLDDSLSYYGTGRGQISNGNLGEIHLLGALSEMLSGTFLNFTSLKLDAAQAEFKLEGPRVAFSRLHLTGQSALIEANGDYMLSDKTLDFTTRVQPFARKRNLLTGVLDIVSFPLATVLEVRLTGPLEKPSWAFVLGPTNLFHELAGPRISPTLSPPAPEFPGY